MRKNIKLLMYHYPGEQSPLKDAVLAVHNTKDSVMKYDLLWFNKLYRPQTGTAVFKY